MTQRKNDSVSEFLDRLDLDDIAWLLGAGVDRTVKPGKAIVTEGTPAESLIFVVHGLFDVNIAAIPGEPVARIGPGEVVGELSFLDGHPPAASVVARETSRVLEISRDVLQQRFQSDPPFAARFYAALGAIVAERLRSARDTATPAELPGREDGLEAWPAWRELASLIDRLKSRLAALAQSVQRPGSSPPSEPPDDLNEQFQFLVLRMNELLGVESIDPPAVRALLGRRVQRELLPYMLLSASGERAYTKPRGYAGDYEMIDLYYRDQPHGTSTIGALIDACIQKMPASHSMRNRRGLLAAEIGATIAQTADRPARVTSIACGPAAEMFDVYSGLRDPSQLVATLLDFDADALGFVREQLDRAGLTNSIRLIHENVVYLALGRRTIDLEPQDLIYSVGLMDYFNDKTVVRLIDYLHSLLRPGGRLILGNFHPRNSSRALMDHVLEWELIHRDESDMNRLLAASAFGKSCHRVFFEEQKINLFAEAVRK